MPKIEEAARRSVEHFSTTIGAELASPVPRHDVVANDIQHLRKGLGLLGIDITSKGGNVFENARELVAAAEQYLGSCNRLEAPLEATDDVAMEVRLQTSIEFILNKLTNIELSQLHISIAWNDGDMRSHCKDWPWFERVSHLFTQDGGKNMHSAAVDAIGRAATKRLSL